MSAHGVHCCLDTWPNTTCSRETTRTNGWDVVVSNEIGRGDTELLLVTAYPSPALDEALHLAKSHSSERACCGLQAFCIISAEKDGKLNAGYYLENVDIVDEHHCELVTITINRKTLLSLSWFGYACVQEQPKEIVPDEDD